MARLPREQRALCALTAFAAALVVWKALSGVVGSLFLPAPEKTAAALFSLFAGGFASDVVASILRMTAGFALAVAVALPFGLLAGCNHKAAAFLSPLVDFLRYIPAAALVPLFVLWFGVGEVGAIAFIFFVTFLVVVVLVADAVSRVPKEYADAALTLGASRGRLLTLVFLPAAGPAVFDGLRVAFGNTWTYVTIVEMIGLTSGIGYRVINLQRFLHTPEVIAALAVVGVIGLATDWSLKRASSALFPWAKRVEESANA
ncbi:MAG: ABC transporter permease [Candidatus Micrarchaeota archaeon]